MASPNPRNTLEEWNLLYHNLAMAATGGSRPDFQDAPKKIFPIVQNPVCDDTNAHCQRHFVDREIACASCGAHAYNVMCHEWPWDQGHYWHSVEPVNGAPPYAKTCPSCGTAI